MTTAAHKQKITKTMEDFINQLLNDQGIPADLDPETLAGLKKELKERAEDFLNRRLLEAMSDEAVEEFGKLIDEESVDPSQVQEFVANHVPNKDQVAAQALYEFRALYLGDKA